MEAAITDFTLLEQKLKTTFMDKFGFSDASLYTDTILDDKWMTEVNNKINLQYEEELNSVTEAYKSASPDQQQELIFSMMMRINEIIVQEREKVLTTSCVYKGHTASASDTTPLGYVNYPFILDQYGLEFRSMRKGELFAIAKK